MAYHAGRFALLDGGRLTLISHRRKKITVSLSTDMAGKIRQKLFPLKTSCCLSCGEKFEWSPSGIGRERKHCNARCRMARHQEMRRQERTSSGR